jgi:hypothetical protein
MTTDQRCSDFLLEELLGANLSTLFSKIEFRYHAGLLVENKQFLLDRIS